MPKLLAVGCSWTDQNYNTPVNDEHGIKTWPTLLGESLGYETINMGISGSGNNSIMKQAINGIHRENPDLICVLWSNQGRIDLWNFEHLLPFNLFFGNIQNKGRWSLLTQKFAATMVKRLIHDEEDLNVIDEFFRNMFILNDIATHRNIPIYFGTAIKIWPHTHYKVQSKKVDEVKRYKRFMKEWIRNSYFNEFDKKKYKEKFIGWPWLEEAGGFTMEELLRDKDRNPIHRISAEDNHPNAKGHEVIANEFLKKIKI